MKPSRKSLIVFSAGLLLGLIPSAIAFQIARINTEQIMSLYSCAGLAELSWNALQIRNGNVQEVLGRYEEAIPVGIVTVNSNFKSDPASMDALWAAQRFYEESPTSPLPADAKAVLASLPPRPPTSCQIKRRFRERD